MKSPSEPAPARLRTDDGRRTHFLDWLAVVFKYKRLAISVFLLVVLGAMLRTYTTTPLYQAEARLLLEMEDESTQALAGAISTNAPGYFQDPKIFQQTQYRILTGREVARRVIRKLDLAHSAQFGAVTGNEAALIDEFVEQVSIAPVPNSHLVDVGYISADPAFAALTVNALAEEYVQQNLEIRRQNMLKSLAWLSQELTTQKQKVEGSERAMAQYREDQNALSLEERQNIVVARLNQLNDAVTKAKMNRVQKESLYDRVKMLDPEASADTIPAILQNPYIQAIKTRLAELRRERTSLLERYGPKYPDVTKINASLEDATQQLQTELTKAIDAIRNDYQSAAAEERTLAAALEEQKGAAMDLNRKSVSYTVLEREAESNRQVYETLLQREKELQVMANSRGNNVRLTDRAEVPEIPFVPTPRRDLILAIVAGLVLALGFVFLLDYLDDTVKTPDDVTEKLQLPLLGLSPKVAGNSQPLLSRDAPHDFQESFRSLRTALLFSRGSERTRTVMVSSAQPLEGKTTTSCNIALALAIGGARVLLVDADMRRPSIHRTLGLENNRGLSHVLSGQARLHDVTIALQNPALTVVTAGVPPPNPSELLGSDAMPALIDEVRRGQFDWVIIDTPPVLPVTDGVVLSPLVDGVVFVIGAEMTQRPHVARAVATLTGNGARMLGAVLNRADLARNRYYYSRYYGYQRKNYYSTPPAA